MPRSTTPRFVSSDWAPARRWPLAIALLTLATVAPAKAQQPAPTPPLSPTTVQDVTVTARRPKVQALIDRKVYAVSSDLQAATGSAADVLNQIPSVDVDADGMASLRGDPNVTILIDGKPAAALTGAAGGMTLLNLSAADIDRIEVMPNPPSRYKAEGSAGVINIITRKTHTRGVSGTLRVNVGSEGRYNLGADIANNTGKWRLSAGVALRHDVRHRITTDQYTETEPQTGVPTPSIGRMDQHVHRLTPEFKAAADYQASKTRSFGASFDVSDLSGHRAFDQTDTNGLLGAPTYSSALIHTDGHESYVSDSEDIHFSQTLGAAGDTLNLALRRSGVQPDVYETFSALSAGSSTVDDLRIGRTYVKGELSADYDRPVGRSGDLKLGYDLEADDDVFDNQGDNLDPVTGQAALDPATTYQFRYGQTVHALYGEYTAETGPWSFDAGLRAEAARSDWLLVTGNIPGARDDFGLYPSLHLDRSFGADDKVTLSVSRRVTRPDPDELNPFVDYQNIYSLSSGNPNLKPEESWSTEIGYTHSQGGQTFTLTPYFHDYRNSSYFISTPLGGGVILYTSENLPHSESAGLEFSLDGKLATSLGYSMSGKAYWLQFDARALGATGLASAEGLDLKASLDWKPTPANTLQASFSRTGERLTVDGRLGAVDLVNFGYRRQIRKDLALVATLSDAFDGLRLTRYLVSPDLVENYARYQPGRVAMIGVIYTFGGAGRARKSDFDYGD